MEERTTDETARLIQELRLEVAAQRLVTRSIIAFLLFRRDAPLAGIIDALREANERSTKVPIADMDSELHAEAAALVRKRSEQLLMDLGPLMTATTGMAEPARDRSSGSRTGLRQ